MTLISFLLLTIWFVAGSNGLRESYSGRQRLVGYWGQDSAGSQLKQEKSLGETCSTTKFDIVVIAFVTSFWDTRNKDSLPGLSLPNHCQTVIAPEYETLLRCTEIEADIKQCQKAGKKVLISVGGPTGDGTLPSPSKARELANTFYDLFLGGNRTSGSLILRPFGTAVLDGIDLDIEGGRSDHYGALIKELRRLMEGDKGKEYVISAAPQCPFPDHFIGKGLEEAGECVDHLYVQFYNYDCHTGNENAFRNTLKQWLDFAAGRTPRGPLVFIGLPAAKLASSSARHYRTPTELQTLYQRVGDLPGVGGIMLWDVSWDQNNVISGKRYSEYAFAVLKGSTAQPTTTTPNPQVEFMCTDKADGYSYADKADCAKYYLCSGGTAQSRSCPSGLHFNPTTKVCDWPANVQCEPTR